MSYKFESLLIEEYKQISEDLRFGWSQIFGFFRTFIMLHLLLISIMASVLGYNFEKTTESKQQTNSEQAAQERQLGSDKKSYEIVSTFILCLLGATYSIGGIVHTKNLYDITRTFVGRADAIEKELLGANNTGILVSSIGESHQPHHIFMNNRQFNNSKKTFNVRSLLLTAYTVSGVLWITIFFIIWN